MLFGQSAEVAFRDRVTLIAQELIAFPLQRQKSRDTVKNPLDVEVPPKIPVPGLPQAQRTFR